MPPDALEITDLTRHGRLVRRLMLNRPDKRNCLSLELLDGLLGAIRSAPRHATIWIEGRGPAFCTGLDLQELFERRSADTHLRRLIDLLDAVRMHAAPTVCVVRALASGGGVALAACCDVAIAAPQARFKLPGNDSLQPLVAVVLPLIAERRQIAVEHLRRLLGVVCTGVQAQKQRWIDTLEDRDDMDVLWQSFELVRECKGLPAKDVQRRPVQAAIRADVEKLCAAASAPGAINPLMEVLALRYAESSPQGSIS